MDIAAQLMYATEERQLETTVKMIPSAPQAFALLANRYQQGLIPWVF